MREPPTRTIRPSLQPAAAAVHRGPDAGARQPTGEGSAGELAALVGVEDLRSAEARQCLVERVDAVGDETEERKRHGEVCSPVDDRGNALSVTENVGGVDLGTY